MDNGDDINIASQPEDNFTTNSILSVMVTGDEDFTEYFCVGDNGFDNSTSDNATLGCMLTQSYCGRHQKFYMMLFYLQPWSASRETPSPPGQ